MFVVAARITALGLNLLRIGAQRGSLSFAAKLLRPLQPVIRTGSNLITKSTKAAANGIKKLACESTEQFTARAQGHFNKTISELGIPKGLEPKLIIDDLPFHYGGIYAPTQHTVTVNIQRRFISKLLPWLSRRDIRHELKHSQQFLDIARHGMNDKLPLAISLPAEIAQAARSLHPLCNFHRGKMRLKQAINCMEVNQKRAKIERQLISYCRKVSQGILDQILPKTVSSQGILATSHSPIETIKSLEKMLNDPVKIRAFEKGFCMRKAVLNRAHKKYLADLFETEARNFGKH